MDQSKHLTTLGLHLTATPTEIRVAYHRLLSRYRSDNVADSSKKQVVQIKFDAIQAAYDALRGKPTKSEQSQPAAPASTLTKPPPQRSSKWWLSTNQNANTTSSRNPPPMPAEIFNPDAGYDFEDIADRPAPGTSVQQARPRTTSHGDFQAGVDGWNNAHGPSSASASAASTKRKAENTNSSQYHNAHRSKRPRDVGLGFDPADQYGYEEASRASANTSINAGQEIKYKTEIETDSEKILASYEKDLETKNAIGAGSSLDDDVAGLTDDIEDNDEQLDLDSDNDDYSDT
ncbi:hypothetical protein EJ08DRAFT_499744 [Tothia fuscella]|uniref:J domain-containing protein n=1 Tax=Tothia fuscella TaxID=1048955 RepID=A0A9P4P071_9PEZI|nr:hypothetical protein EJ08DRAFT_499744 [Tothia fuscella]